MTEAPPAPAADQAPPHPAPTASPPPDASPADPLDGLLHRIACAAVGIALIVAFGLPWIQITDNSLGRHSGLELAIDGVQSGSSHALIFAIPTIGLALILTAWWGRKRACRAALFAAGLLVMLGGAWQTLLYVAAAIGPGLWVLAGAGVAALLSGMPWKSFTARSRPAA